jgi:hypothetical protein
MALVDDVAACFKQCNELRRENDVLRAELARAEAVLVAADRVREAYEAMMDGRDVGWLADWQPKVASGSQEDSAPQPAEES